MIIQLPEDVKYIINTLQEAGYQAYAVGGCVRDTILGREPQDWDITTSACPDEIKALFRHTIDTGIQHGTVTVMRSHVGYEVTTYRIDGEYEDNRHPKSVSFTDNLKLDLERRDFTINAMAYNEDRGLIDEFDGIGDMERKVIRCVGDAGERFDEDALRMLRAVRFSGQLGFSIEKQTRQAIPVRAGNLKDISAERIRVELTKLLTAKDAGMLREAYATGMTAVFLPELDQMMETDQKNPHHIYTVGEHSIHGVEVMNFFFGRTSGKWDTGIVPIYVLETAKELIEGLTEKQHVILCLTMLLHDAGKPETMTIDEKGIGHFYGHPQQSEKAAVRILRRLTFDNETIRMVKRLVYWHDYAFSDSLKAMRRAVSKMGRDLFPLLFLVQFCDILSQNPELFRAKLERVQKAVDLWREILHAGYALELRDLEVTGKDIMALGIKPGPQIGELLQRLLEEVLEFPEKNRREILLKMASEWIENG
ncbi:MAG: CCA tRNA nucleotidyltransferase [Clostridiaceae bacterium]|nr:CCA tRNA nucleotidyltransferase [Clostridiaceae bacterium]